MDWLECNDSKLVSHALTMWANWIQTGDPSLSPSDLHNYKAIKPKILEDAQMRLVLRLRDLAATVEK